MHAHELWLAKVQIRRAEVRDAKARANVAGARDFLDSLGLNCWGYRLQAEERVRDTQRTLLDLRLRLRHP